MSYHSYSQNSCVTLYLEEPTRSGYLESSGIVNPGDRIEICLDNNTIKVGDYFYGWISNVNGSRIITCNYEIISEKIYSNLKGKMAINTDSKLFQMAEYVNGRPTGEQMIFEYSNDKPSGNKNKIINVSSGKYNISWSNKPDGYPEYIIIDNESNTITNGYTGDITYLKNIKWNEKENLYEGSYKSDTKFGSVTGSFLLSEEKFIFSLSSSSIIWKLKKDLQYEKRMKEQQEKEEKIRLEREKLEKERLRSQYIKDSIKYDFIKININEKSIDELTETYKSISSQSFKSQSYKLITDRLTNELSDTVKLSGDSYDEYLKILTTSLYEFKTGDYKIIFDKSGNPTLISDMKISRIPKLPESSVPTKTVNDIFSLKLNSSITFSIDSARFLNKDKEVFYSIKNIRGNSTVRKKSNGSFYRPSILKNSIFHESIECSFNNDLDKKTIRKNTYMTVKYFINDSFDYQISQRETIVTEDQKLNSRIPKSVWRVASIGYITLIIISFI